MVTPVGIGGAALSHGYTTPSTDEDAVAAINRAAELGIAYVDTSPGYGESMAPARPLAHRRCARESLFETRTRW